jgi:RNA polymerase sigma factor (sigma-70 family)
MESASVAESPALEGLETPYPGSEDSANTSDLAKLLARLDADPEQAALKYEHLRRALIRFFDWRGASPADECADEALDRLTRRLSDTTVHDVYKYAHGIARLVLLERRRAPVMASIDDVPEATLAAPEQRDDHSELQGCFERCLAGLPEDSRQLLLGYYEGQRMGKILNRRRLASMLGITESALRNRVQRLRDRLELCVQGCVGESVNCTR